MTEKQIHVSKFISHVILVLLSMLLSVNLFVQFSTKLYVMLLFGSMAVAFEIIKLYILVRAKDRFQHKGWRSKAVGTAQFAVYLGLAAMSALASIGFTLTNIEEQSFISKAQNEHIITVSIELEQIDHEIDIIRGQIENKTNQINSIANSRDVQSDGLLGHVDSLMQEQMELFDQRKNLLRETPITEEDIDARQIKLDRLDKAIEDLNDQMDDKVDRMDDLDINYNQIDSLSQQIDVLNQQQIMLFQKRSEVTVRQNQAAMEIQAVSSDVFTLLGAKVRLSGPDTMLYMMLTLVILLEISIALTSSSLKRTKEKSLSVSPEEKKLIKRYSLIDYINGLLIKERSTLASDYDVSRRTGIPLSDCLGFKQVLQQKSYKGRPLITDTRTIFSKASLLKIVRAYYKSGTISSDEFFIKDSSYRM